MKKLILIFCSLQFFGQGQISLEQCQEKARSNYPLIKQLDLIEKSTEYNLSNAGKSNLPQLSLTGIAGYIFTDMPSLSLPGSAPAEQDRFKFIGFVQLHQTIWDGGASKTQKEIVKSGSEIEKANVDVSLHALKERVNQIYFGILLIDERIKNLNNSKDILNRSLNKITVSKNNGSLLQSDADEIKSEELFLEQKLIELDFARKGYLEVLSVLTGSPMGSDARLQAPVEAEPSLSGDNNRPERKLFNSQKNMVMAQAQTNRVGNMPKVSLMGAGVMLAPGINLLNKDLSNFFLAGLNVSWNTANLYRSSNNKSIERIQMEKIMNQEEVFNFNTKVQSQQNNAEINKQKAVLQKDDEIVSLKKKIRDAYQLKFDNGLCSVSDLLNAGSRLNESEGQRSLHKMELMMSIYQNKLINGN